MRLRRSKSRRVSARRARPIPEGSTSSLTPRGKGASRFVMTVVFLVGSVVILNAPIPEPPLRVGDLAKRDYRARTTFQVVDEEATRRRREAAAAEALRVFQENTDHLARLPGKLEKFLVQVAEEPDSVRLARVAREQWGLTPEQFGTLARTLDRRWIGSAAEAVQIALREAGRCGIMAASEYQTEFASDRNEIEVRRRDGSTPERRFIAVVKRYPGGLRDFLDAELRLWFHGKPPEFREVFLDMLVHAATPTLRRDDAATAKAIRAAREAVRPLYRTIEKGSILLAEGDRATPRAVEEISLEAQAFAKLGRMAREEAGETRQWRNRALGAFGRTLIFLAGFLFLARYCINFARETLASNTKIFGAYVIIMCTLLVARLLEQLGVPLLWAPVVLSAMVLVIASGPMLAFGVSALLAVLSGIITEGGLELALPLLAGGAAVIPKLTRLRRRTDPFEAGCLAGLAGAVFVWALYLARMFGETDVGPMPVTASLAALGSGLMAGILVTASLPYLERFFDVVSDMRLLEWSDHNQPLLRKLALEAPGTYHHSTVVGNMAEAAAKEVHANPLLARAGGYLHDIGKLNRPDYFIENTLAGQSRHDRLSPMMSTLILTAHVKDGTELAREYNVPAPLRRIIAEHHGTCLVPFFYKKARDEADGADCDVDPEMFRYRGPKPRTPESAIVMLADAVESASRTLSEVSSSRVERLVREIVQMRLEDGQLDNSRMSLTDIRRVEASLVRSVLAMTHRRIRYPSL